MRTTIRRLLLILLSPLWLTLVILSLLVGLATFSGTDLAAGLSRAAYDGSIEGEQLTTLAARFILLPFQLTFIGLVIAAALWIVRRRQRFGRWVLGDSLAERWTAAEPAGELPPVLLPHRRRTLQQIFSSLIAVVTFFVAALLCLGQFIAREDLAVVVAALTSSLAWGARLPIGDLLGGISNIFESNLAVGDRIEYRQVDRVIEGVVEAVDLRFLSVRASSGELTTIPFGELRIFRNYSRGDHVGVYTIFPITAPDLGRAVALLNELAPESVSLVPYLVEPWQAMSLEGEMGAIVDLCLFGKTTHGCEDDTQAAIHAVVHGRFAAAGIRLAGKEDKPS